MLRDLLGEKDGQECNWLGEKRSFAMIEEPPLIEVIYDISFCVFLLVF